MRIPFKNQMKLIKKFLYMSTKPELALFLTSEKTHLDILAIAFNNEIVIDYQIRLLKNHLTDSFTYTVIDNSSDSHKQGKIRDTCISQKVNYVRPPKNPFYGELGSRSHGVVLNWAFRHVVEPRQPGFFGFIDHDIFPISETSILAHLSRSQIYGRIETRGEKWYLWPGFCFFRYQFLFGKRIDFMPGSGVDTGGKNWDSVYSKLDRERVSNLSTAYGQLRPGDNKQTDWFETMGDWIHTVNASEWVSAPHKNKLITALLDQYL